MGAGAVFTVAFGSPLLYLEKFVDDARHVERQDAPRGGRKGTYDVGVIPTGRAITKLLAEAGFRIRISPRELWINYLRDRVSRPEEVRPGLKRSLSRFISSRKWPFENPVMRWVWDVSVGSNFIIAQAP